MVRNLERAARSIFIDQVVMILWALLLCGISLQSHAADDTIVWQSIDDPNIKSALFDSYTGQHFSAITRLRAAQKLNRVLDPDQSDLVLGGLYLSYGFYQEAAELFKSLLEKDQPKPVQDQAWFYLAKAYYKKGQPDEALVALAKVQGDLGLPKQHERLVLQATLHLKQKQYADAVKVLGDLRGTSTWELYGRYNMGVAAYHLGQQEKGLQYLADLGQINGSDAETSALRDKANITLGYGYLQTKQPDKAKIYLERMLLDGPSANQALLALGRTYSELELHEKSLVPWSQLATRDASDEAVQDALMAVPYAFGQLNAYKQSLQHYEKALEIFQTEINNINKAAEAISGNRLLEGMLRLQEQAQLGGSPNMLGNVLKTPEGRYLWHLMTTHEFRQALYNYAQLRLALGRLEQWSAMIDTYDALSESRRESYFVRVTKLQSKVLHTVEKLRHHLHGLAFDELERRKQRLVKYYNEARFSVAQIYDYAAKRWGTGSEK